MKLSKFIEELHKFLDSYGDNSVVVVTKDKSIGCISTTPVSSIAPGFDWESGKILLYTEDDLIKLKFEKDK